MIISCSLYEIKYGIASRIPPVTERQKEDALCRRLFEQAGSYLGSACAFVCTIMEPELLILSGAMLSEKEWWGKSFEESFRSGVFPLCGTQIVYSELSSSSSALGAAFYALEMISDDLFSKIC